jgi:hypothetical protein
MRGHGQGGPCRIDWGRVRREQARRQTVPEEVEVLDEELELEALLVLVEVPVTGEGASGRGTQVRSARHQVVRD